MIDHHLGKYGRVRHPTFLPLSHCEHNLKQERSEKNERRPKMNVNYIWNMKVHIFEDDETTVGKRALRPGLKWVVLNGTTAPDGRWQRFGGKASTICPPLPLLLLLLLLLHLPTQVHHLLPTWSNKNLSCNRRQKPLKLLLIVLFFNVASMFCVRLHSFSWTDALPQEADAPRGGDMDKGGHMAKKKIPLFYRKNGCTQVIDTCVVKLLISHMNSRP